MATTPGGGRKLIVVEWVSRDSPPVFKNYRSTFKHQYGEMAGNARGEGEEERGEGSEKTLRLP